MALRDTLGVILPDYGSAKKTKFAGNALAAFIRGDATLDMETAAGNWAEVSWLTEILWKQGRRAFCGKSKAG